MSIRRPSRLYIDHPLKAGKTVTLGPQQTHYVLNVMRHKIGDAVLLFNGVDGEWRGTFKAFAKTGCLCSVDNQLRSQTTEPDLWLYFAPIKRNNLEYIIQKASELGTSVLQPINTQHTQIDHLNIERLQAIAIEAAEQCERLTIPRIRDALKLREALTQLPADRAILFCAESGSTHPIAKALQAPAPHKLSWRKALIVVGPEGGFSREEVELLCALPQAVAVSLGPRILRADTASVAAMTCWQSLCGDWTDKLPDRMPYTPES